MIEILKYIAIGAGLVFLALVVCGIAATMLSSKINRGLEENGHGTKE